MAWLLGGHPKLQPFHAPMRPCPQAGSIQAGGGGSGSNSGKDMSDDSAMHAEKPAQRPGQRRSMGLNGLPIPDPQGDMDRGEERW